jgi:hypothetical protein
MVLNRLIRVEVKALAFLDVRSIRHETPVAFGWNFILDLRDKGG